MLAVRSHRRAGSSDEEALDHPFWRCRSKRSSTRSGAAVPEEDFSSQSQLAGHQPGDDLAERDDTGACISGDVDVVEALSLRAYAETDHGLAVRSHHLDGGHLDDC